MAASKAIAIIDDEVDLVNLFQEALENNGFKVCVFTDPIQAFNHIQKNPNDYGLILSDYRMPVMNGNELCTKLMRINSGFKVILMSAYEYRRRYLQIHIYEKTYYNSKFATDCSEHHSKKSKYNHLKNRIMNFNPQFVLL
jgi:DNA-binding NtrC family response regulator